MSNSARLRRGSQAAPRDKSTLGGPGVLLCFTSPRDDGRVGRLPDWESDGSITLLRLRQRRIARRHQIHVTHHSVYLPRLPASFARLRVVQVSDIHHGLYTRLEQVERAVALANDLEPDLVALTGDFVTHSSRYIAPVARALGGLRPRLGAFAVLGNHDHRAGADAMARALERHGIDVLRNRHAQVAQNGDAVTLAGVDDFDYGQHDLARALRGANPAHTTLLLSHNPAILSEAAQYGVDLVLAGHTHGGQVDLPGLRSLAGSPAVPLSFRHGWEQVGSTQIYISRGIGTVVVPLRVRCPAEIPLLRLEPADGQSV